MRNRMTNVFADSEKSTRHAARLWKVDRHPGTRLVCLFVLMVLPLAGVFGRLVYLQSFLGSEVIGRFDSTTETFESIPSGDGRILSSDGSVLASDLQRFDVWAHYRWIEEPADDNWLLQQALSRLSRIERRDRKLIVAEKQNAIARRNAMWHRLSTRVAVTREETAQHRQRIQQRVERIVERVEQRRAERNADIRTPPLPIVFRDGDPWWNGLWMTVVSTLTTPPRRYELDPIVVQEELEYHQLFADIPQQAASEIEAHPELFPGLRVRLSTRRVYPQRSLAAHVVGVRLQIGDDDLRTRREQFSDGDPLDYRQDDRIGKTGVERSYDRQLHGLRGVRRITKNHRGEMVAAEIVRAPRAGRDITLTLHLPLQQRMEQLLDELLSVAGLGESPKSGTSSAGGGAVIALNVQTGAVLVAASAPRFDLNLLVDPDPKTWRSVTADPRRPFFSRLTQMALPPGSVFKTLTAMALMESGRFDPDQKNFCQGYLDHPNRYRCYIFRHQGVGHGEMDLTDALCQSCNVFFFSAARKVGPQPIVQWARRFGFGRPTGIDLPGERAGNLPTPPTEERTGSGKRAVSTSPPRRNQPAYAGRSPSAPWYRGDTLGLAIGQSRLTVTPLQIVRMMAAVANGGYLVTPHVVTGSGSSIGDASRAEFVRTREPRRIPDLSEAALGRVREGLEKVVSHPRGTGYKRVRMKEIAIAGKTGTAEVGGEKNDHAWFAGYVPADQPRIAFVVVLEHAGSGGRFAGPLARKLVEAMLKLGVFEPTQVTMRE